MNCDCLDENCEVDDWSEQQLHDCSFIEELFQNIPLHILTNMYDAVQYVTTLEVNESKSHFVKNSGQISGQNSGQNFEQNSNQNTFNNPTSTQNETIITIKIARKLDIGQTIENFNQFIKQYPKGFTETTVAEVIRCDDEHDYCDADTGEVKPFPEVKGIYVEYSDDSEDEPTTLDSKFKSKRRQMAEAEHRRLALHQKGKRSAKDGVDRTGNKWTKIKKFNQKPSKNKACKYEDMTEEDLPKSLEEPRTSETGQTKEDLDEAVRNLYFDRANYPRMIYKKGVRPEFPNRTNGFYQCPYTVYNIHTADSTDRTVHP